MNARQPVLIDVTPLLPTEDTLLGAIAEAEAEQATTTATRAEGIRAMISAPLAEGAADRVHAAFTAQDQADQVDDVEETEGIGDVDLDALRLSPRQRALIIDHPEGGPWHYQARKGVESRGLVTDITAETLTPLGVRVRAALLTN